MAELFNFLKDDGDIDTGGLVNDPFGPAPGATDPGAPYTTDPGTPPPNDQGGGVGFDPNQPGGDFSQVDWSTVDPSTVNLLDSIGLGPSGAGGDGTGGLSASMLSTLGQILSTGGPSAAAAVRAIANGPGGASGLGSFLSSIGSTLAQNAIPAALMAPFLAQAYKQYSDSSKYADAGKAASQQADPFGQYRQGYAQKLQQSYDDPGTYLKNDPTYNFLSKEGLAGLGQTAASSGNLAFNTSGAPVGAYGKDMIDYSQGLASKTLDTERTQLASLAGSQFNPAMAAQLAMQGTQQQITSQNAALGALGGALNASRGYNPNPVQPIVPAPMAPIPDPGPINPMLPNPTGGQ